MTPARETTRPKVKADAQRRCIVTREQRPQSELIRFVVGPNGEIVPDLKAKLPGRGIWVHASSEVLDQAVTANLFSKAAKAAVTVNSDLSVQTEHLLSARCLDLLGLGQKAGQLVTGFEKVSDWLRTEALALVIEASDGRSDGRRKIIRLTQTQASNPLIVGCFNRDELGLALGRDNVVHAALKSCSLARTLETDLKRLAGFRALCPPDWSQSETQTQ